MFGRFRFRFRSKLRRLVFWAAVVLMLVGALVGLVWAIIEPGRKYGPGPIAAVTLGLGALLVALVFGLLEFTDPTWHPESELFSWSDVDSLRELARRPGVDAETREWARSLADRIAVVLPGRPAPPESLGKSQRAALRRFGVPHDMEQTAQRALRFRPAASR